MVGLEGGFIFSPFFVLLKFPVTTAVSASLFLNGIAAVSAAITYFRKRMVDVKIGLPLRVSSALFAPLGAMITARIDISIFTVIRMLISKKMEPDGMEVSSARRIIGGAVSG